MFMKESGLKEENMEKLNLLFYYYLNLMKNLN